MGKGRGGSHNNGPMTTKTSSAPADVIHNRLAELTAPTPLAPAPSASSAPAPPMLLQRFVERKKMSMKAKAEAKPGKKTVAVVRGEDGAQTGTVMAQGKKGAAPEVDRSPAEAQGLKLLRRAVLNQSHNRVLPFHGRHDFEFRLRRLATSGVVQLFNAVAAAQKAAQGEMDKAGKTVTVEKAEANKVGASRDAFLSALKSQAVASR